MREERENHRFALDFFSGFVQLPDDTLVTQVYAIEGSGGYYCGLIGDVFVDVVVDFQGGKDRIIRRQGDRGSGGRLSGGRGTGYQEAGGQVIRRQGDRLSGETGHSGGRVVVSFVGEKWPSGGSGQVLLKLSTEG